MTRLHKRVAMGAAVVIVGIIGYLLLRPRALAVETTPAVRAPMQVTIDEEGEIRVRDRYLVAAPVTGEVRRITLKQGDPVRPGEVVATLVPLPMDARARAAAQARLSQAEDVDRAARAQVTSARAALDQARRARTRAEQLAADHALAPAERERVELEETTRTRELESADFRQQATAHEVEAARAALAAGSGTSLALRSPVRGKVLRVPEPSARVVATGEPLLELGDNSALEIVTDLLSSEAVKVTPGAPLLVDGWGGPDTLHGLVRRIEPAAFTKVSALGVEEQRVNVIGDLSRFPPALGDRFRVQVHIVVWESPDAVQVPNGALFRKGDGWNVFVIQEGTARERAVKVGQRSGLTAEILEGLAAGEVVIRNPTDQIADGVRVRTSTPK